jgi:hypothetical protein
MAVKAVVDSVPLLNTQEVLVEVALVAQLHSQVVMVAQEAVLAKAQAVVVLVAIQPQVVLAGLLEALVLQALVVVVVAVVLGKVGYV